MMNPKAAIPPMRKSALSSGQAAKSSLVGAGDTYVARVVHAHLVDHNSHGRRLYLTDPLEGLAFQKSHQSAKISQNSPGSVIFLMPEHSLSAPIMRMEDAPGFARPFYLVTPPKRKNFLR